MSGLCPFHMGLRGEYIEWDMYQNNQDCEWTLTSSTGLWGEYIEWDMYPNNQDCEWTLTLPQGYGVSIQGGTCTRTTRTVSGL